MSKSVLILFFLFISLLSFAGNDKNEKKKAKSVVTRVTDTSGEAVAGASIYIIETNETVFADIDGQFRLTFTEGEKLNLRISVIGFQPLEISTSSLYNFAELELKSL